MAGRRLLFTASAGTLVRVKCSPRTTARPRSSISRPSQNERVSTCDNRRECRSKPAMLANTHVRTRPHRAAGAGRPGCGVHASRRRRRRCLRSGATFDASGSTLGWPAACGSGCSYCVGLWRRLERRPASVLQHAFTSLGRVQRDADGHVARARDVEQHDQARASLRAPALPMADFTTAPCAGRRGQVLHVHRCIQCCQLASQSTGTLVDFGDGSRTGHATVRRATTRRHVSAATYTVRLTVTDNSGPDQPIHDEATGRYHSGRGGQPAD